MMLNFLVGGMVPTFPRLVFIALLWASATWAVALNDLFHVKQGNTEGGLGGRAGTLQSWLDDTETLVTAMLQAMPQDPAKVDKNDENLKDNLAAYFKIRVKKDGGVNKQDEPAYTSVRSHLEEVDRFLKQQNPTFQNDLKPYLFYNSDWLEETETLFDANGNPVQDNNGQPANSRTYTPANFNQLPNDDELKSFLLEMRQGTSPNWSNYAYWSKDIRDYLLEPAADRHRGNPPSFCNSPPNDHMFALTITRMTVDSVTICPDSFDGAKSEPFETIAQGIASPAAKNEGSALQATSPRGLTLFHELIHLVKGPDSTKDSATKPTACMALVTGNAQAAARVNPDNFVFFAWSYYLSKNGDPKLKWHTGIATK